MSLKKVSQICLPCLFSRSVCDFMRYARRILTQSSSANMLIAMLLQTSWIKLEILTNCSICFCIQHRFCIIHSARNYLLDPDNSYNMPYDEVYRAFVYRVNKSKFTFVNVCRMQKMIRAVFLFPSSSYHSLIIAIYKREFHQQQAFIVLLLNGIIQ